ncbi:HNH endonuclease [Flexithrix dorotheae]|uniref:HNH endonuclease n=1 Tax=Flexithrix dorotheae TaxID=70993 RepID=UPI00037187ED|nr:HNH endonuclease [Flexithrix dorotheae]
MEEKICIFCNEPNESKSIEHIIPESLGNKLYVMPIGSVCDECNSRFSKHEQKALEKSILAFERSRFGIETKAGKTSKGNLEQLKFEGDKNFTKGVVSIKDGIDNANFKITDPKKKIGKLTVPSFDKSEVSTSKLLLKMGLESIYISKRKVFDKNDFTDLKNFLGNKNNTDWPFVTRELKYDDQGMFKNILGDYKLRYKLRFIYKSELKYYQKSQTELLFRFNYGSISFFINLLNRGLDWIPSFFQKEEKIKVYPHHFEKKVEKLTR